MSSTNVYTIERLTPSTITTEIAKFFEFAGNTVNEMYGKKYAWRNKVAVLDLAKNHYLAICRRDGVLVGLMVGKLYGSIWDCDIKVLRQELLFSLPKTRASKLLLDDFIDFGKSRADHIYTAIGTETNIKGRSLERLGFTKLEEFYRMENKR